MNFDDKTDGGPPELRYKQFVSSINSVKEGRNEGMNEKLKDSRVK